MSSISGCTIVRNAVKLKYPLEASIASYYPICDDVVLAYDPDSEDETEEFVRSLALKFPKIRLVPSRWDLSNHDGGTEITIQSNVAVDACTSDWILYVQADEAIHEGDHEAIKAAARREDINGLIFDRRSFLGSLDREIPEYYAKSLLRMFRNGLGLVVGDGMTCAVAHGVPPLVHETPFRMFNYSRMGDREEILLRSRYRDNFHISTPQGIEENLRLEGRQTVRRYDPAAHPAAIQRWYGVQARPQAPAPEKYPVTLALLLGPGERENVGPFLWQFRGFPGDVAVLDDMTEDGTRETFEQGLRHIAGISQDRIKIVRAPLKGDFAAARNLLQEMAQGSWVLATAPDERWDRVILQSLVPITEQLEKDGKLICGFPRANFVDGVLVNDVPDSQWTEEGLLRAGQGTAWPPRNPDFQYRLLRKEERWEGRIHENPRRLRTHSEQVVVLADAWILHNKSLARQRRQDGFYRSLGQTRGMPRPRNLRESTLAEVIGRLPRKKLVVVETGTLRDANPSARESDGWSTYCLAELLAKRGEEGSKLYSIDISPDCVETSRKIVPEEYHKLTTWICKDAREAIPSLEADSIDLLYLDSSDDPKQILAEFQVAAPKLGPESIVIVDDTGPYHAGPDGKGTLVIPFAKDQGWQVERRDDERCHMTILSRQGAA
jgi:hypothetical protein